MDSNDRDYDEPQASTVLYDPVDSSEYEFVSQLRKNIIMVAYYRHSIFFVHGLNGHPFHSWKHKNSCVWPRDLLPRADGFGSSRIISLAYNSKIVGSGATTQSLFDHARGMLADVRGFRHEVGVQSNSSSDGAMLRPDTTDAGHWKAYTICGSWNRWQYSQGGKTASFLCISSHGNKLCSRPRANMATAITQHRRCLSQASTKTYHRGRTSLGTPKPLCSWLPRNEERQ